MKLDFYKVHEDARVPEKNHKDLTTGDAGLDVFSVEDAVIPAKGSVEVKIGLKVAHISPGFWVKIEGRSGLAFKKGITPFGGIIDNGYRGEIGIKLINSSDEEQTIEKGTAVAQLIVYRMIDSTVSVQELPHPADEALEPTTARGTKGFGSSDKKVKKEDDK